MHAIDKASALYWYCADYHTGQGSRLYSVLSQLQYEPARSECSPPSYEADELYNMPVAGDLDAQEMLNEVQS